MEVPSAHFTISVRLFFVIVQPTSLNMTNMLSNYSIHYQNLTWDSR